MGKEAVAGVYISYPFCKQKCTFCNFASGVFATGLEERYLAALHTEIVAHHWKWRPETVYLGGGTPGAMAPEHLAALLTGVPGRPWLEATLEVSPGLVTADAARQWVEAGINRISLGVQSFIRSELARTGRKHNADTVAREVAILRKAGIRNFNIDLIAGLPGQSAASWSESLDWVERLDAPHVSVYMLEVDEDSRLGREILAGGTRYGACEVPGEEQIVELYELAAARLHAMGIAQYEISNFARSGMESQHNLKYWRMEPYTGFGADAHSFDGITRCRNAEWPEEYVRRFEHGESPRVEETAARSGEERLILGLRLREGVRLTPEECVRFDAPLRRFLGAGLLESNGGTLRLTPRGILLSNEVFQEFLVDER